MRSEVHLQRRLRGEMKSAAGALEHLGLGELGLVHAVLLPLVQLGPPKAGEPLVADLTGKLVTAGRHKVLVCSQQPAI